MSRALHLSAALTALALVSSAGLAQPDSTAGAEANWRGFLGCWTTAVGSYLGPDTCLLPTTDPYTIELVTINADSIASRTLVSSNGAKIRITRDGCTGWESGRWSLDERRLYTEAVFSCNGGGPQQSRGLYAMTARNAFSRIESLKTRSSTGVRVISFVSFSDTLGLPAEVQRRMPVAGRTLLGVRANAAADVSTADVLDASKAVGAPVVEAWLADLGQRFVLNVRDLRTLRDAGVETSVIDMMVAVSNPEIFTIARGNQPDVRARDPQAGAVFGTAPDRARGVTPGIDGFQDPGFVWSQFNPFDAYGSYGGLYADPNRFSFQPGLWNPNTGGQGWLPGPTTYVIIPTPPQEASPPGRAINGSGYSQGGNGGGGGRTAQPAPMIESGGGYSNGSGSGGVSASTGNIGAAGGGSPSAGSAGSAGSTGSTGSTGSSGRTAKERP
jgi:hypothetical protein